MARRQQANVAKNVFPELLEALSPVSSDLFGIICAFESLKRGSLKGLRLSCKVAQKFVDNNITELSINVSPAALQAWSRGQLPGLDRWPNCRSVIVTLYFQGNASISAANLVAVPFAGLSSSARHKLTSVRVQSEVGRDRNLEAAVPQLVALLPKLRLLDLTSCDCMSYDPLQQQLMYDSLVELPCLEELRLLGASTLDRVGTLARSSSLTRLVVQRSSRRDVPLSPQGYEGLSLLQRLTHLELIDFSLDSSDGHDPVARIELTRVLDSLPPSVEAVAFTQHWPALSIGMRLKLRSSQLEEVSVQAPRMGSSVPVDRLAGLAKQLLDSRVLSQGRCVEHLEFDQLFVNPETPMQDPQPWPLRYLVARCKSVRVRHLRAVAADMLPAMDLLGCTPDRLALTMQHGDIWLKPGVLGLAMDRPLAAAAQQKAQPTGRQPDQIRRGSQQGAGSVQPTQDLSMTAALSISDVDRLVLHRMTGQHLFGRAAHGVAAVEGSDDVTTDTVSNSSHGSAFSIRQMVHRVLQRVVGLGARPVAGDDDTTHAETAAAAGSALGSGSSACIGDGPTSFAMQQQLQDPFNRAMLLLTGSHIAMLEQCPEVLDAWLQWLAQKAGLPWRGDGFLGDDEVVNYQLLPACCTPIVLVDCVSVDDATALVAAAREAASGQPAGALEVSTVVMAGDREGRPYTEPELRGTTVVYLTALEQVIQELWDSKAVLLEPSGEGSGGAPAGASGSNHHANAQSRLQRVLAIAEQLGKLRDSPILGNEL